MRRLPRAHPRYPGRVPTDTPPPSQPPAGPGDLVGRTLGKYEITGLLGTGGMGVVYRAHDASLDRDVAIKILPAEMADDDAIRERFLVEAKAAARLNHPNVVAIHEIDEIEQTVFIVMELVGDSNAAEHMGDHGPYDFREATRIAAEACKGMAAAHTAGLVHRDIKPANLLKNNDGTIKIADFGLAKGASQKTTGLTQEGTALGTPSYMSPEQCEAKEADRRSDIYSLGATYYALLVGEGPYDKAGGPLQVMYAHCKDEVADPRDTNPELPAACSTFIRRAMAKDPADRFQDAQETREHLERVLLDPNESAEARKAPAEALAKEPASASPKNALPLSRRTGFLVAGALVLIIGAALALFSDGDAPLNPGSTDQGVTGSTILLGTSTAYSGASRDLGQHMVEGLRAAFAEANDAGGIHGRRIELVVLDDGYEPERTRANMEALLEDRKVFAIVGNVGTPTARVAAPRAVKQRRLFFAPFTGARFLRAEPPERYIFNVRASYHDETRALVRYWIEHAKVPADKIAVFAQEDAFGDDGFQGVARALRAYGVDDERILRVGYKRNTVQVDNAIAKIVAARERVEAVVMVSTAGATAAFVRGVKRAGLVARFGAVSFVGAGSLAERFREMGGRFGEGVIVTEVVPDPMSSATGVLRYREALSSHLPQASPGNVSLEGYVAGRILVEGLERAGPALDTETLVDALEGIRDLDLGIGPVIRFGPSDHEASERVWGTVLGADGTVKPLELDP